MLALAITSGKRFRSFIHKHALQRPSQSASIMSLIILEGPEAAKELLKQTFNTIPNQEKRVNKVLDLYFGYTTCNFDKSIKRAIEFLDADYCYPLLFHCLMEMDRFY